MPSSEQTLSSDPNMACEPVDRFCFACKGYTRSGPQILGSRELSALYGVRSGLHPATWLRPCANRSPCVAYIRGGYRHGMFVSRITAVSKGGNTQGVLGRRHGISNECPVHGGTALLQGRTQRGCRPGSVDATECIQILTCASR